MVLDLNAIRQELQDTKNQFNSTKEDLEFERQEKKTLLNQLEVTSSRLNELE